MYEYQSKPIEIYFELIEVCRKATSYFVGSFMMEMILRRKEWENPKTKNDFITAFHQEYFAWEDNATIDRTRNRVNCIIRIIESKKVEDALQYVLGANDLKIGISQVKINAQYTLDLIKSGKLKY